MLYFYDYDDHCNAPLEECQVSERDDVLDLIILLLSRHNTLYSYKSNHNMNNEKIC